MQSKSGLKAVLVTALLCSFHTAAEAFVMRSLNGFQASVAVTGFYHPGTAYDGIFDISFTNITAPLPGPATLAFQSVDLNQDIQAQGAVTLIDSPTSVFPAVFTGQTVYSGMLHLDHGGAFAFDGINTPQNYPQNWTLSYDGTISSVIFPVAPPVPVLPGPVAGSLEFTVMSIGVDAVTLRVNETVGPNWSGFEALMDGIDFFSSQRGIMDGTLEIAAGTQFHTPLPAAFWLFGTALAVLAVVSRSRPVRPNRA